MPTFENTPRPRRRLGWWWAPVAVLVVLFIAFLFPWKLNFLRDTIAKKVEDGTGRSFTIGGDIWLYWLQGPRVTLDGLRLGNPAWASTPQMAVIDHVDAKVSLGDLLHKRVVLTRLEVVKPIVNLEEGADGKRSWYFDKQQNDSSTSIVVRSLAVDQGHIGYVAKEKGTDVQADLASLTGADVDTQGGGATNGIAAKATGTWNGLKLRVDAKGGDLLKLEDEDTPYPFNVKATIGSSRVSADGTVTGVAALKAADLKVTLAGSNLAEWYRITGVGLPETPPYQTSGHVRIADNVYHYDDFTGKLGSSDIGGSVAFEKRAARPFVSGTLVSKQLDLKDLAPMTGKKLEPAVAPKVIDATKPQTLMPQLAFSTDKWNTLDADIHFTGKSIKNAGAIPFDNLEIHATMKDRVLAFTPLSFGFADGKMGGNFRFDGSASPMHATVDARFVDLSLARLTPKVTDTAKASLGRLNGDVKLEGRGNSIAAIMASADGTAQIAMGRGESSSLLLELIGLQGPQVVRYLLGDKNSKISCAIGDFTMTNGDMTTKTSLVDTGINVITFVGDADFKTEKMDFTITPLPKKKSIFVLRTPFHVTGTFVNPSVLPDFGTLAARAGGAIALGLINPLAALIPLIETGPGRDSDCAALLAKVKSAPVKNIDRASQVRKAPAPKPRAATPSR
ncbi:MAG: AsmA family protein [Burkholderiaceae bacterium]